MRTGEQLNELEREAMLDMAEKLENIQHALIGNKLTEDGGLVRQIKDMKDKQEKFELTCLKRIQEIEETFSKWKGIGIGLFISGGVIGYLIGLIVDLLTVKKT